MGCAHLVGGSWINRLPTTRPRHGGRFGPPLPRVYRRGSRGSAARAMIGFGLMAVGGLGAIFVGFFPENENRTMHIIGAFLAIGLGNVAIFALGAVLTLPESMRRSMLTFSALSLAALVCFAFHKYFGIGGGTMERLAATRDHLAHHLRSVHLAVPPEKGRDGCQLIAGATQLIIQHMPAGASRSVAQGAGVGQATDRSSFGRPSSHLRGVPIDLRKLPGALRPTLNPLPSEATTGGFGLSSCKTAFPADITPATAAMRVKDLGSRGPSADHPNPRSRGPRRAQSWSAEARSHPSASSDPACDALSMPRPSCRQ